jgi:hypothetical protein
VPEESAYPDPLKRDDPKPLQTAQYEAIGILLSLFINPVPSVSHMKSVSDFTGRARGFDWTTQTPRTVTVC